MSKQTVTLEGLPGLQRALQAKVEELRAGARLAVVEEVKLIEADAKSAAAVLTGELRDGISSELGDGEGTVSTASRHSAANEFGTFKMGANPFMQPAAERARRRIPKTFAATLRRALGG